jgi:hypothetical protein
MVPTAKPIADFHRQAIAHAGHTIKKAGLSSFENTPAHYAGFPYSVVYGGSNPSSMPKMADVICEIGGRKIGGQMPQKGRCHAALTAWHL